MRTLLLAAVSVPLALRVLSPTHGAEAFYIGTWKLSVVTTAPWAGKEAPPEDAEKARLIGKSVVLRAREIAGPKPFACSGPKYKVSDFTADLLFQGAFEEMQSKDKSADPAKLAASLGFTGSKFRTLETGCEIDFHFVDNATAEVALNNNIYTLKKQ